MGVPRLAKCCWLKEDCWLVGPDPGDGVPFFSCDAMPPTCLKAPWLRRRNPPKEPATKPRETFKHVGADGPTPGGKVDFCEFNARGGDFPQKEASPPGERTGRRATRRWRRRRCPGRPPAPRRLRGGGQAGRAGRRRRRRGQLRDGEGGDGRRQAAPSPMEPPARVGSCWDRSGVFLPTPPPPPGNCHLNN